MWNDEIVSLLLFCLTLELYKLSFKLTLQKYANSFLLCSVTFSKI